MANYRGNVLYAKQIAAYLNVILIFFVLFAVPKTSAFAASVNLAWGASSGANVTGYRMYYGTSSRNYSYSVNVGNSKSCSLTGLKEGVKYYFAATAYCAGYVESPYSPEFSYTIPIVSSNSSSSSSSSSDSNSSGTSVSTASVILDNGGSGASSSGSWKTSGGSGPYGANSLYSKTVGATYTFQSSCSGNQDVYIWYTYYASRYTNVPVKIYNGSTLLKTVYVDQQQKQNAGNWYYIGTYNFSGTAKVVIESKSSSASTSADAVKFVPSSSGTSSGTSSASSGSSTCTLNAKFKETPMKVGAYYYTDRSYTLTGGVSNWANGFTLIQTVNDERSNTSSNGYLKFTHPVDGWVYVLFDSRSSSIPNWLKDWELLSDRITTSLSSQPYLKVYRKQFDAGQCVDLGGNYGSGSSIETRSNYGVVYEKQ
jgi:hypothetical protein